MGPRAHLLVQQAAQGCEVRHVLHGALRVGVKKGHVGKGHGFLVRDERHAPVFGGAVDHAVHHDEFAVEPVKSADASVAPGFQRRHAHAAVVVAEHQALEQGDLIQRFPLGCGGTFCRTARAGKSPFCRLFVHVIDLSEFQQLRRAGFFRRVAEHSALRLDIARDVQHFALCVVARPKPKVSITTAITMGIQCLPAKIAGYAL